MAGPVRISILANGRQARNEFSSTSNALGGLGKSASKAAALVAKVGVAGAVAGVGAVVKFTKDAAVLDTKMREVVTLFGETGKAADRSLGQVQNQVRSLSDQFGIAQETLTGGLYQAISAGVPRENALQFMQVASKAAIGGVTDVETAVDGLSTTINAFGLDAKDASAIADSMFTAVKGGKTTFDELSKSLFNVAPAAAAAGVDFTEVNAALATLTAAGTPTSVATTQIRAALVGLQKPSEQMDAIFQKLGYTNAQTAVESKGLRFALDAVKKASKGNNGELQKLLGSSEAVAATNVLAATGAGKFADELRNQEKAAGAATKAFQQVNKGTERQFAKLTTNLRNVGLSIGQELLPHATNLSRFLLREAVPQLERFTDYLEDNGDEITSTAGSIRDGILPPLKTLVEIVRTAGGFFADIPGPVKEIGVQAGIAALVLPRLTAGVTSVTGAVGLNIARLKQFRAELTYMETRTQRASAAMTRMGGAARGVAGIGGLVALTQSAGKADTAVGVLGTTAGGAAVGFSVAGPLGAAVGGMAGAIYSMTRKTDAASDSFTNAKQPAVDFSGALDQITGAAEKGIRSLVLLQLQQDGAVEAASMLGISTRDLVGFMLDQEGATARVQGALAATRGEAERYYRKSGEASEVYQLLNGRIEHFNDTVAGSKAELKNAQQATRENALATMALGKVFKGLPKKAITKIRAEGIPETAGDIRGLAKQYKLTPKQIRTVIRQTGVDTTVRAIQRVIGKTKEVGKAKPDLSPFQRLFKTGMDKVKTDATLGGLATGKALKTTTAKARPDLNPFTRMFNAGLSPAKTAATSGGNQIGGNLKAGVIGGFAGTQSALAAAASGAVRAAIAAARAAAKIKSPSREMAYVGEMMGEGLARGMEKKKTRNRGAGGTLVKAILKDVGKGLDGLTRLIEKKTKEARGKAILGRLKDEYAGLRKVGQALDKNDRRLEKAVSKHKQLVQESKAYAKNIKDSAVSYGSVVGLGVNQETGIVSTAALLSDLANRAVQVERYATLVQQLKSAGLNKTTIQQLLDAGVEGGLATAEAIAAGGASAIGQINTLTSQIGATGGALGDKMAKTFYGAGLKAAAGIVRGLEKKEKELDRVAERLANSLVKKVKDALGIKSPSRVFEDIGARTVQGLTIGLDETYVRRAGSRLAGSLQAGFGQPALDAYMSSSATSGQQTMTIHLTADELSAIEQGRRITAKVDAYRAAGGRVRA